MFVSRVYLKRHLHEEKKEVKMLFLLVLLQAQALPQDEIIERSYGTHYLTQAIEIAQPPLVTLEWPKLCDCVGVEPELNIDHWIWRSRGMSVHLDGSTWTLHGSLSLHEREATITFFGTSIGDANVVAHELLHYLLWKFVGLTDADHKSPLWEKCAPLDT